MFLRKESIPLPTKKLCKDSQVMQCPRVTTIRVLKFSECKSEFKTHRASRNTLTFRGCRRKILETFPLDNAALLEEHRSENQSIAPYKRRAFARHSPAFINVITFTSTFAGQCGYPFILAKIKTPGCSSLGSVMFRYVPSHNLFEQKMYPNNERSKINEPVAHTGQL